MKGPVTAPLNQLILEPYASILCFPKPSETEIKGRLEELSKLGIIALEFSGKASIYGVQLPVLGKGFVGIVVVAHLGGQRAALKIRRTDADRADLIHEARMLAKANLANVGPKLVAVSKNFLVMQLIEGDLLPNWLKENRDSAIVKRVLGDVLKQCFRLDEVGLNHGELSKAPKHIIVDKALNAWIVDFETSSDLRKPANLSAICSYFFCGQGEVARTISETIGKREVMKVISALRNYKEFRGKENFERVFDVCLA